MTLSDFWHSMPQPEGGSPDVATLAGIYATMKLR
jgi:hypothetical protein